MFWNKKTAPKEASDPGTDYTPEMETALPGEVIIEAFGEGNAYYVIAHEYEHGLLWVSDIHSQEVAERIVEKTRGKFLV